uniref:Uncharacterized protein n=1 Tax=Anguilla anguilla TaxID=7936 RepID=A0A0E9TX02_ANGAN
MGLGRVANASVM